MKIIPNGPNFILVDDAGNPQGTFPSYDAAFQQQLLNEYMGRSNVAMRPGNIPAPPPPPPVMAPAGVNMAAVKPVVPIAPAQQIPQLVRPDQIDTDALHQRALAQADQQTALNMYGPQPEIQQGPAALNFAIPASFDTEPNVEPSVFTPRAMTAGEKESMDLSRAKGELSADRSRHPHMETFLTPDQMQVVHLSPQEAEEALRIAATGNKIADKPTYGVPGLAAKQLNNWLDSHPEINREMPVKKDEEND